MHCHPNQQAPRQPPPCSHPRTPSSLTSPAGSLVYSSSMPPGPMCFTPSEGDLATMDLTGCGRTCGIYGCDLQGGERMRYSALKQHGALQCFDAACRLCLAHRYDLMHVCSHAPHNMRAACRTRPPHRALLCPCWAAACPHIRCGGAGPHEVLCRSLVK